MVAEIFTQPASPPPLPIHHTKASYDPHTVMFACLLYYCSMNISDAIADTEY